MKILLIGKTGQLGQALAEQANQFKITLKAYGHDELDILQYKQLESKIKKDKPDVVINTSAYHVVPDCDIYPEKAFAVNAIALKNLSELCRKYRVRLVTYSTDYVFDGSKNKPYVEDDRTNPLQMYGLSKLAGEIICLNYHNDSIVIRTNGVYGGIKGSRSKKGNFVLMILNASREKKLLEVSSEQIVNPTYTVDLAEATYKLLKKRVKPGIYHLANEGQCSWAQFAQEIVTINGSKLKIIPVNRKGFSGGVYRPKFSVLKNKKAHAIGIHLPTWQNALKRYITYLQKTP